MPDDDLRLRLGRAVRAARARQGLTQGALADRLRMRRTSVTNIEAGEQGMSVDLLVDLAGALGLRPQDLLEQALVPGTLSADAGPTARSGIDAWTARVVGKTRAAVTHLPDAPARHGRAAG